MQRVENDAEGAVYEAHVLKADGTPATVKMDGDFKVTGIETGGAPTARDRAPHRRGARPQARPPLAAPSSPSAAGP